MRALCLFIVVACASAVITQGNDAKDFELPKEYATKYLIEDESVSPNKQFAVMVPQTDVCGGDEGEKAKDCKDYHKNSRAGRYNDYFDFIFDSEDQPAAELKGSTVQIHAAATTDPKQIADERAWDGRIDGVWDIAKGKFTSVKVTRVFAGKRKREQGD